MTIVGGSVRGTGLRTTSDILPGGVEATTRAGQQSFLLLFLEISIELSYIEVRRAEQHRDEYDEIDG